MKNEIELIPSYWASVSGGKDSLYMLKLILSNPERYPLDGVCHFELEIDFPFIHDVVDYMEKECLSHGIRFERFKPSKTWEELYYTPVVNGSIWGFPTRKARWCNSHYKLSAKKALENYLLSLGRSLVSYIGLCADELPRLDKRKNNKNEIFPLAENGITEDIILEWAKSVPIFNHYYEYNKRCGCMFCPLSSMRNFAYTALFYPDKFAYMIQKMKETEQIRSSELGRSFSVISSDPRYNADYLERIVKEKYIPELIYNTTYEQLTLF